MGRLADGARRGSGAALGGAGAGAGAATETGGGRPHRAVPGGSGRRWSAQLGWRRAGRL